MVASLWPSLASLHLYRRRFLTQESRCTLAQASLFPEGGGEWKPNPPFTHWPLSVPAVKPGFPPGSSAFPSLLVSIELNLEGQEGWVYWAAVY